MSVLRAFVAMALVAALHAPALAQPTVRQVLAARVPEVKLTGVGLGDAVEFVRDLTGLNVHVNWRALELIGIGRDAPINLELRDVRVRKMLDLLLDDAGQGLLAWYVDENIIRVTTAALADDRMITQVYPIDDLLLQVPNFSAPDVNFSVDLSASGGRGGGGGGMTMGMSGAAEEDAESLTKEERADRIVELITSTVRPEVWAVNGGRAGIRHFRGNLIVTAPASVHELIAGPPR